MTLIKCFITAVILITSHHCDKVTIPTFKMQPSFWYIFLFKTAVWNWNSSSVQIMWSVRLVLKAISHSRHVLMPVSSMNLAMNDFCFCWTCTVLKRTAMAGTGSARRVSLHNMPGWHAFMLRLVIKRNCHPSSFFFFFYPDFSSWGRDQTAA